MTSLTVSAAAGIYGALLRAPVASADAAPTDDMGRWAPDERWTKWQEDVDRGYAAYKRKDYLLAEKIYLRALSKARAYKDNPSRVVEVLAKLIVSLLDQGDLDGAEPYYKEVLALATDLNKKRILDEMGAICMEDLSTTYEENSGISKNGVPDLARARARAKMLLKHAIDIRANVFSEDHPKLIISRNDMANLCIVSHDWSGARVELEKIRNSMKTMSPKGRLQSSRYIVFLGCVYEKLGRKADADKIFADLQKLYSDAGAIGDFEKYRGNFYRVAGEPNTAEVWYRKELATALKEHSKYGEMLSNRNIGYCYEDRDQPAEAEKYFRRGLELAKKHLKVDTTHKFTEMINEVERALREQKKYKEADRFHVQEADFLRVKNPLFKTPTQLYQEEIDILKEIDSASKMK